MLRFLHLVAALAVLTAGPVFAGDFDGSKPLICAPVEAIGCVAGEACTKGRPAAIGAPNFLRIDFAQKVIVGPKPTPPIQFTSPVTSWMARIGLASPSYQQWLMTSCARRSISGLPRCTESKSSAAVLEPAAIDEAAPPPMPMRMPGPPSWISKVPAANSFLWVWLSLTAPRPPAIMIGL